jgi:Arc/MetJ-type ribon-helix-helix transcriptional regulator
VELDDHQGADQSFEADRVERYDVCMHRRVTITIDEDVLDEVDAMVAAGKAKSVSALISDAVEKAVRREKLADVMADLLAEVGPPSAEDEAWVKESLGLWSSTPVR